MDNVPEGAWRCPLCAVCVSCAGEKIKKENRLQHAYKHAIAPPTEHHKYPIYLATYCKVCYDNFSSDRFCPVCLKTYSEDEDEEKEDEDHDMVACDTCDYWVHVGCDEALTPDRYQKLCDDEDEKYNCPLCEGRVKPIVHTGHAALALKGVSAPSGTPVGIIGGKVRKTHHHARKEVCAYLLNRLPHLGKNPRCGSLSQTSSWCSGNQWNWHSDRQNIDLLIFTYYSGLKLQLSSRCILRVEVVKAATSNK